MDEFIILRNLKMNKRLNYNKYSQTFTFENTTNLVPTFTRSDGRIIYLAQ